MMMSLWAGALLLRKRLAAEPFQSASSSSAALNVSCSLGPPSERLCVARRLGPVVLRHPRLDCSTAGVGGALLVSARLPVNCVTPLPSAQLIAPREAEAPSTKLLRAEAVIA